MSSVQQIEQIQASVETRLGMVVCLATTVDQESDTDQHLYYQVPFGLLSHMIQHIEDCRNRADTQIGGGLAEKPMVIGFGERD
jgi:hypothetical protein